MAMKRIFWGFSRKKSQLLIDHLHYLSSHSDFGFKFAETFVIEKQLSNSLSRSRRVGFSMSKRKLGESATPGLGESIFHYEYLRKYEAKINTARNVELGTYGQFRSKAKASIMVFFNIEANQTCSIVRKFISK